MKAQTTKTLAELGAQTAEQLTALFTALRSEFDGDAAAVRDEAQWKTFRDEWMGRKAGVITNITENWLKKASSAELKKATGQALNEFRAHVEAVIEERRRAIEAAAEQSAIARERVDLSLPGVMRPVGTRHPIRQTFEQVERIFLAMGYQVVAGPEIETPYYNFEALNIPEHHPARDNMDTFYMQPPAEALRPGAEEGGAAAVAHAHFADANPHHGKASATCADHRAGARVQAGQSRRNAFVCFPPSRGAGGGHRSHLLRFRGDDRLFHPRVFRSGDEIAIPAEFFPVHRAVGGIRRVVHFLRRQRCGRDPAQTARSAKVRDGSNFLARGWWTRRCTAT